MHARTLGRNDCSQGSSGDEDAAVARSQAGDLRLAAGSQSRIEEGGARQKLTMRSSLAWIWRLLRSPVASK